MPTNAELLKEIQKLKEQNFLVYKLLSEALENISDALRNISEALSKLS